MSKDIQRHKGWANWLRVLQIGGFGIIPLRLTSRYQDRHRFGPSSSRSLLQPFHFHLLVNLFLLQLHRSGFYWSTSSGQTLSKLKDVTLNLRCEFIGGSHFTKPTNQSLLPPSSSSTSGFSSSVLISILCSRLIVKRSIWPSCLSQSDRVGQSDCWSSLDSLLTTPHNPTHCLFSYLVL